LLHLNFLTNNHIYLLAIAGFIPGMLHMQGLKLGYDIIDNSWKEKGIMTEALQAIIPYGFDQLQLNRIEAFIGPNNTPSLKLMHKFGFQQEGLLRAHYCKKWHSGRFAGIFIA
jgi:ribosomal-protein-alanine N-acetyltransferase